MIKALHMTLYLPLGQEIVIVQQISISMLWNSRYVNGKLQSFLSS